jgi:hypothetical protein
MDFSSPLACYISRLSRVLRSYHIDTRFLRSNNSETPR